MRNAKLRGLENKDRIGVEVGAAAIIADVGDDVADADVADRQIMFGGAAILAPAAQYVGNVGGRAIGVMRVMGAVHGDHVELSARPDIIIVIGCDAHALRGFQQKSGMANEGQPQFTFPIGCPIGRPIGRPLQKGRRCGDHARTGLRLNSVLGFRVKGKNRQGGEQNEGEFHDASVSVLKRIL